MYLGISATRRKQNVHKTFGHPKRDHAFGCISRPFGADGHVERSASRRRYTRIAARSSDHRGGVGKTHQGSSNDNWTRWSVHHHSESRCLLRTMFRGYGYAETCRFSKPVIVNAGSAPATVQITAPRGIRMRVRILDPGGLLSSVWSHPNPLLQVFASNQITRVRFSLQLEPSSSISNAYEAAVVIPISTDWYVAMNSVQANLFDSNGSAYQFTSAIPRPNDNGDPEFLAVYTIQAK